MAARDEGGTVADLGPVTLAFGVLLLVGGFAYAAAADLKNREVSDVLWQVLGLAGFAVGLTAVAPGGALPVLLWCAVAALTLEHMFGWDSYLGRWSDSANLVELAAYVAVVAFVLIALDRVGLGASGVPVAVLALLVSVVFARGLFEAGVLYGGADAKALMIAGLLVPMFPTPWVVGSSGTVLSVPAILPFPVDLLMNAALISVVIPIGIAVRNVLRGEFSLARGFTGYSLGVKELPDRFVWVRDRSLPSLAEREAAVETSAEDRRLRVELARELSQRGVRRVWVSPQLPFLVLMALGAVAALLAGNLVIDLLQWL